MVALPSWLLLIPDPHIWIFAIWTLASWRNQNGLCRFGELRPRFSRGWAHLRRCNILLFEGDPLLDILSVAQNEDRLKVPVQVLTCGRRLLLWPVGQFQRRIGFDEC